MTNVIFSQQNHCTISWHDIKQACFVKNKVNVKDLLLLNSTCKKYGKPEVSAGIWQKFKLIQDFCMSSLPASLEGSDQLLPRKSDIHFWMLMSGHGQLTLSSVVGSGQNESSSKLLCRSHLWQELKGSNQKQPRKLDDHILPIISL